MKFNVDKCSVLVFNPNQSSPHASNTLDGNPRQITQETKYLGVVIQSDLPTTFIPKLVKQNDSWVWLSVHYLQLQRSKIVSVYWSMPTTCEIRCC